MTQFEEPLLFGRTPNHRKVGEVWMVKCSNKQGELGDDIPHGAFPFSCLMVGILIMKR